MAITDQAKSADSPVQSKRRLAGVVTSILGLLATGAAAIGLISYLVTADVRGEIVAYLVLLLAFAGMGLVAGVQLLQGRGRAQQFLLVYWLGVVSRPR